MTYYDVAMVCMVIAGMVWGAWRGITWQVASIASLVLGYTVSQTLSSQLAPQLPGDPVVARAVAMMIIYVAVSGGVFLAAWIVRTTLRKLQFEAYDRHLGMVLGGLEGTLLGMLATLFVVSLAPQTREPIFTSPTGRVVGQVMAALGPVLPSEARSVLAPFWNGSGEAGTLAGETETETETEIAPRTAPELVSEPGRSPTRREAARETDRLGETDRDRPANSGQSLTSALTDLVEQEEAKLGRAIVDTAQKQLQQQLGTDGADGRAVKRR